ncbi:hypothetical protein NPIL_354701 [Nephila pilipes]|uniref:Uncharacterized protein n=1 Tax=Nephila pilipes TaxID=299642 RepID=A0A8X6JMQ5_NEPPI|nr:hypothetical protein NPIL_354701 [Nephila pilipes]
MGRQLRVQRPPIRNILDFRDSYSNIWYNLSPVIYQGLVASMHRRVETVLCAKVSEKRISSELRVLLQSEQLSFQIGISLDDCHYRYNTDSSRTSQENFETVMS